jgi:hypothetical protein
MHINEDPRNAHADGAPPAPPPRRQTSLGHGSGTSSPAVSIQQMRKPVAKATPPVGPKPAVSQEQLAKLKAAPPVARKPAHLAGPTSPASSISGRVISDTTIHGSEISLPELPRRSTTSANGFQSDLSRSLASFPAQNGSAARTQTATPPLQPIRRTNTSTGAVTPTNRMAPAGGIPLVGLAAAAAGQLERKPVLPARKPTMPVSVPAPAASASASAQKQAPPPPPAPRRVPTVDLLADDGGMEMGGWEALKPSS